ncbi:MAG TPA: RNA methyltransferase [Acidobacteria bacterium]|nr:RNA methyltransferase [Acidobacteriota bacterium]
MALERLHLHNWDFPDSDDSGLHTIHPYPAKFISSIPRALITSLGVAPGTAVLDPFCGAGTTLVVAQELGVPSIGIDLNPIACLISRVKTTPLPAGLTAAALRVVQATHAGTVTVPAIPNVGHWFNEEVSAAIAALVAQIDRVPDASVRDHLRLALSSIIVRVSRQESDTRYAAIEKPVSPRSVREQFLAACARIVETKAARSTPAASAVVLESDILAVTPELIGRGVSLVVTSPPYPNAYEYWLYHKYRMWWLGYDPIAVKQQEIGARAHYFRKRHATFEEFRLQMASILRLLSKVLVSGGYACFVVGRSRIHGVDYDNAAMIAGEAGRAGFTEVDRFSRVIRAGRKSFNLSHARIKTEAVLVLRRS